MTQLVMVFVTKSDNLNSIAESHIVGQNQVLQGVCSLLSTCMTWSVHLTSHA